MALDMCATKYFRKYNSSKDSRWKEMCGLMESWRRTVKREMKECGLTWLERQQTRSLVNTLCVNYEMKRISEIYIYLSLQSKQSRTKVQVMCDSRLDTNISVSLRILSVSSSCLVIFSIFLSQR
uniref:Uncharacterized protein n=1 Tax=Arion vulgaris TaxID=1028688 RepID=A0A0B6Y9L7_9EUPU